MNESNQEAILSSAKLYICIPRNRKRQAEMWIISIESKKKKKSLSNPEPVFNFFSKRDVLVLELINLKILTSFVNFNNLVIRPSLMNLAKLLY